MKKQVKDVLQKKPKIQILRLAKLYETTKHKKTGLVKDPIPAAASIIVLTLLRDTNSLSSATSCLGVLSTDTETPVVPQPTVVPARFQEKKSKPPLHKIIQFK